MKTSPTSHIAMLRPVIAAETYTQIHHRSRDFAEFGSSPGSVAQTSCGFFLIRQE